MSGTCETIAEMPSLVLVCNELVPPMRVVLLPHQRVLVGRKIEGERRVHIQVPVPFIHSVQAELFFEAGEWHVRDTASAAGTYVDEGHIGFEGTASLAGVRTIRFGGVRFDIVEATPNEPPTFDVLPTLDRPSRSPT